MHHLPVAWLACQFLEIRQTGRPGLSFYQVSLVQLFFQVVTVLVQVVKLKLALGLPL